jgi:superfamily II DNA or RNA helicase
VSDLRPYQIEAIDAAMSAWEQHRSVLLVMATGTGKTRTAAEIIRRRAPLGRILWLAHREELITQAAEAIEHHAGIRCEIEKGEQRASTHTLFGGAQVVVASVQTLHEKRRSRFGQDSFATVVIDEAHHAPAKTYRDIVAHFSSAKLLGLTATPDRGDAIGLGNVFEIGAYQYDIKRAIDDGYLCKIVQKTIECADLDISDIRTVAGDLNQGDLEQAMSVDAVLHQVAGPLVKEAKGRPTIVFTVSVAQAKALADVMAGYVDADLVRVVSGETPSELRRAYLSEYASGRVQYLINCAVLTEGFDAPSTACVAVARPTKSRALYAQIIGRGTRLAPGKENCLVLDFVGNAGRHKLVSAMDVLAGRPLPPEIEEIAKEMAEAGMPVDEAIEAAEKEAIEREKREQERRRQAARLKAEIAYRAQLVNPFSLFDLPSGGAGPRATEKQLEYIRGMGVEISSTPSRKEASELIDKLADRRRRGLCTYKQARTLAKHGLPTDLSFPEAREALDAIAGNGWRVPLDLRQRYARAAE